MNRQRWLGQAAQRVSGNGTVSLSPMGVRRMLWAAVFALAAQTATGAYELSPSQATVGADVGRVGNIKGGALPDPGDELVWRLPANFREGVYQVVIVGRSGARQEGRDFVGAYRIAAPTRAYPRGAVPRELHVYIPDGIQPKLLTRAPSYYVFQAPMYADEKLYLRPGDELRVYALVGWAHVYKLRLEPVPPGAQHDLRVYTERLASLFGPDEPATLIAAVTNWRPERRRLKVAAAAVDEGGREVASTSATVELGPREQKNVVLPLKTGKCGPFWARIELIEGTKTLAAVERGFGVTPAPDQRTMPDESPFGIHKADLSQWPRIGAKWVRLWDTGDTWNQYEPERGKFVWERLDKKVADAQRNAVKILYVLAYTPTWASARPDEPHYTGPGARAEPKNIEDWKNFIRVLVRRYRGRIAAYEVWNEPNAGFFTGTVEAYVRLLRAAYNTIKQEDPEATVVGISGTGSYLKWMEQAFKLGALRWMDAVSVHTYTTPRSPEEANLVGRYQSTHELIRRYGGPKPLWNTEVGIWQPERDGSRPLTEEQITARAPEKTRPNWQASWPYRPVSEEKAAEYCVRTYLISLALGVKRLFWYTWRPHIFPMYTDANEPRLMTVAYGGMTARLNRAQFVERVDLGSRRLFYLIFRTPRGYMAAAWTASRRPIAIALPTGGRPAVLYDIWGNATAQRATKLEVKLSGRPIYIEGLDIASLRRVTLAGAEIVLQSTEARIAADVNEKNVREHTSRPYHGDRRVMGLPDAGDALVWKMPPALPPGIYEICVDGFTGRRPPGTDYVSNYVVRVHSRGRWLSMGLKPLPGAKIQRVRENRWYGLMVADRRAFLEPGDEIQISSRAPWAFVGPLKLRRVKAGESKRTIMCPALKTGLRVDGFDSEWQGIGAWQINQRRQVWIGVADRFASTPEADAWQGPSDCSAVFKTAWTQDGIAVFVRVRDDKTVPAADGQGAWAGDCVEIFVDARGPDSLGKPTIGEGVYQILCPARTTPGPVEVRGRAPSGTRAYVRPEEHGYCIEAWIPAKGLVGSALKPGMVVGFDIAVDDADEVVNGRAQRKAQLVFHGTVSNFQDPSVYALLRFIR